MPYISNSNYHTDEFGKVGYFYQSNRPLSITYTPSSVYTDASFVISPSLQTGLLLAGSGSISGTTSINTLYDIDYTVTVRGRSSPSSLVEFITTDYIRIIVSTEPKFTYLTSSYVFVMGNIINIPAPVIQALLWDTYYFTLICKDISENIIPENIISIDAKTGIISGKILNYTGIIKCDVIIFNKFINYKQDITIESVIPLQTIVYTGVNVLNNGGIFEFIQGSYGILQTSTQSSNGEYSISGCNNVTQLPLGLSFDNSGNIFGSPQTISEPHIYTITFSNSFENTSVNIAICIKRKYVLTPSLSYDVLITPALQMRRKAECLQHKSNKNNESSNQRLYKMINRRGNRGIECLSVNVLKSSSSSDVPGPSINLFHDPATQFIGNVSKIRPSNILP